MTKEETIEMLSLRREVAELKGILLGIQVRNIDEKIKELQEPKEKPNDQ